MPTTVGTQRTESGVINAAAQLEMDCVAAYHEAATRLKEKKAAAAFDAFEKTSARNRDVWQARLAALGSPPATANRITAWLNAVKVRVAAFVAGDWGIWHALGNNTPDQCTAYARVVDRHLSAVTNGLAVGMLAEVRAQASLLEALKSGDSRSRKCA